MKPIYYHILAIISLTLASCTAAYEEPATSDWPEGEAPIAFKAVAPSRSRDALDQITLNGTSYKIYGAAVLYNSTRSNGYYTKDDSGIFHPMKFDTDDNVLYLERSFFPTLGMMDIFSYGIEATGKEISATAIPQKLAKGKTADYMVLNLKNKYDGTYDVIAADRIVFPLHTNIKTNNVPFGHFHHIMSYINVKVKWASDVSSDAWILDRFYVNSVQLKDTPCQGMYYLAQAAAEAHWEETGDDVMLTLTTPQLIDYTDGVDLGGSYIVPQTSRQPLVLNYTLVNGSDRSSQITMNYVVQDDPDLDWKAGHKYTYIIKIGDHGSVTISNVKVEKFADGNVGETVIR